MCEMFQSTQTSGVFTPGLDGALEIPGSATRGFSWLMASLIWFVVSTNQFEKYGSQIGNLLQGSGWK